MSIYDETVEEIEEIEEETVDEEDSGEESELDRVIGEIEAEHCCGDPAPLPRSAYEVTSVLELDRIQKGRHEAIFKGSGPITQLGVVLGDDYKNFDIGDPHIINVRINPQQMTIDEAPTVNEIEEVDEDQMTIEDIDESEGAEDVEDGDDSEAPVTADDDERPWPIDADSDKLV